MARRIRNAVVAGLAVLGGLLIAQAPASAEAAGDASARTVFMVEGATAQVQMLPDGCRYGGWFQFSDGRVVHVIVCD